MTEMSEQEKHYYASIDNEFVIPATPQQQPQQPRDDQGRFAAPEKKFKREIDLKDGSGKQVFEADSQEELIDKLAEAQENATKKIKEQNRLLKSRTVVMQPDQKKSAPKKYQPKNLSTDEEFIIAQQFGQNPRAAFAKLFEAETGMTLDEFRMKQEVLDAVNIANAEAAAAFEFIQAHQEDYKATKENEESITNFLNSNGLAMTRQNLEYAFTQLSAANALTAPGLGNENDDVPQEPEARIEQPAPKKKATGLSDRGSQRRENPTVVPSVDEIQTLPLDQARDRIVRALYEARMGRVTQ